MKEEIEKESLVILEATHIALKAWLGLTGAYNLRERICIRCLAEEIQMLESHIGNPELEYLRGNNFWLGIYLGYNYLATLRPEEKN